MGMDVAIAKRRLGGQHVVLRICRGSELTGDFDDVSVDGLNGLLLSKNFLQLMEAIESLGPISAEKLNSPTAKAALADDERERVVPAGEVRELFRSGELSEPDAERLGEEAYLEYLGNGTVNKSAMRKMVQRYDATGNGFISRLDTCSEGDAVSIELVQDWMDLRNNLTLAARVKGFMLNPPELDGVLAERLSSDPLLAAGFERAPLKRGLLSQAGSNYKCFADYGMQYRRLCAFNTYFARDEETLGSKIGSMFLSLGCQAPLLQSRLTTERGWITSLKGSHVVNYLSIPLATNFEEGKERKQNYLSVCFNEGDDPKDVAKSYLGALLMGWLQPEIDKSSCYSEDGQVRLRRRNLVDALWSYVLFPGDYEIAICKNCGNAFLRSGKGRVKIWCSDSCRVQFANRGEPEEWALGFYES